MKLFRQEALCAANNAEYLRLAGNANMLCAETS
jgi:hypothetical protein